MLNNKKATSRNVLMKPLRVSGKEKNLKATRKNKPHYFKEVAIRLTSRINRKKATSSFLKQRERLPGM